MNQRIYKEFRAIWPAWVAALVLPLASLMVRGLSGWMFFFYLVGCAILGAMPFGSEYSHQTIAMTLAQPISRRRIWYEKMEVLGLVLASVSILPGLYALEPEWLPGLVRNPVGALPANSGPEEFVLLLIVPPLCALGAGSCLALVLKNVIAATLLAPLIPLALSGVLAALAMLVIPEWVETMTARQRTLLVFVLPMSGYAAVMYLLGCRKFARLEAIDPLTQELKAPAWIKAATGRRFAPREATYSGTYASLARKELHLHSVAFLLGGLFCLSFPAMMVLKWLYPTTLADTYALPLVVYSFALPLVIGAVTVAEERNFGLLEWHLVLPPSRWKQWGVKIATAYGTLLVLGGLVPIVWLWQAQQRFWPSEIPSGGTPQGHFLICLPFLALGAAVSIYASSRSPNTLGATLRALGLTAGVGLAVGFTGWWRQHIESNYIGWPGSGGLVDALLNWLHDQGQTHFFLLPAMLVLLFLGAILWLAYTNYRRLEGGMRQGVLQFALVIAASDLFLFCYGLMFVSLGK